MIKSTRIKSIDVTQTGSSYLFDPGLSYLCKFGFCNIQVIQREPWEHIKDEDIKKTAASFYGEIWQVPPMFSAIKVC